MLRDSGGNSLGRHKWRLYGFGAGFCRVRIYAHLKNHAPKSTELWREISERNGTLLFIIGDLITI